MADEVKKPKLEVVDDVVTNPFDDLEACVTPRTTTNF